MPFTRSNTREPRTRQIVEIDSNGARLLTIPAEDSLPPSNAQTSIRELATESECKRLLFGTASTKVGCEGSNINRLDVAQLEANEVNEDTYSYTLLEDDAYGGWSFFALYDGH